MMIARTGFMACLLLAAAGCVSFAQDFTSGVTVPVRIRIFEVPADQISALIRGVDPETPGGSHYNCLVLPPWATESLFAAARPGTGVLSDRTQDQCFWPVDDDLWTYAHSEPGVGGVMEGGMGTGGVAVRPAPGGVEADIRYRVEHDVGTRTAMDTSLAYAGVVQPWTSVVFLAPLTRRPGERNVHVIAFTFGQPRPS